MSRFKVFFNEVKGPHLMSGTEVIESAKNPEHAIKQLRDHMAPSTVRILKVKRLAPKVDKDG